MDGESRSGGLPCCAVGVSALIVVVPEAEDAVGRWRERDDPSAARGVPAYVTLLYPFLAPERIDDGVVAELEHYFAGVDGFRFRLARVGRFPTTVYLMPEPSSAFSELTAARAALALPALRRRLPRHRSPPRPRPPRTTRCVEEAADAVATAGGLRAVVAEAQLGSPTTTAGGSDAPASPWPRPPTKGS